MNKIRSLIFAACALALLYPSHAFAAASTTSGRYAAMCAPPPAGGAAPGPRRVVNTSSTATTQPSYLLDARGCARIESADVGFFQSQGFTPSDPGTVVIFAGPFTAQSTTTNSPTLPANVMIEEIVVQETTGNAVTGGLDIGVAGSSDATIASAVAVGANGVVALTDAAILKKVFPTSGITGPAAQQIFFNAHTNWTDGASILVTIIGHYY